MKIKELMEVIDGDVLIRIKDRYNTVSFSTCMELAVCPFGELVVTGLSTQGNTLVIDTTIQGFRVPAELKELAKKLGVDIKTLQKIYIMYSDLDFLESLYKVWGRNRFISKANEIDLTIGGF